MAPNLKQLAQTNIEDLIDPETLHEVLSSPPFLPLPSALNIRDIGRVEGSPIAPGLIYTSGFLSFLSPEDSASLTGTYGVKRIFDLRTRLEREKMPEPEVKGADMIWVETELDPATNIHDFAEEDGIPGYQKLYWDIIEIHAAALGRVLRDLATLEEGAVLFHCTAGKDRTGVLAAILLSLAGADQDFITFNYTLSRIGVESARTALLNALQSTCTPDVTQDTPGFKEACSMRPEYIRTFLAKLDEEYGGAEGYCKNKVGLTEDELDAIRKRLKA